MWGFGRRHKRSQTWTYCSWAFWRSVTAKPWTNHYTKYGKCCLYVTQNSISKMRSDNEQTRLIVCERPLQEHTHTSALVTTPRVTENDAPNIVCMCVLCVWVVVGQTNPYFFPNEFPYTSPTRKQESLISIHR